jgi:chromosome partitioning protein
VQGPRRIAFINEKGGSAKTTLVTSVASYLALRMGRRVLAIDMDPQGQLGKVLGIDVHRGGRSAIDLVLDGLLGDGRLDERPGRNESGRDDRLPIAGTRIPGLDAIVANKSLALFSHGDTDDDALTARLDRTLNESPEVDAYDFVLFDAPPSFGPLTLSVLRAAREVVVPVPVTYLALDSCAELMRTVETVQTHYDHPALQVTMVIPTFWRRTRLAREILERLQHRFPKELSHSVLGHHVKIDEAQSHGLSIFEYAPGDRGARVLAELAEELAHRAPDHGCTAPLAGDPT